MQHDNLDMWQHPHAFGQERKRPGESRTVIVILITGIMMVVEILAGVLFGSMALLADGLHMASHAAALGITAFAYVYARRHARDERYAFGTGKVNTLGAFTSAVLLAVFALMMAWESIERLVSPVAIAFDQAILVAVLGLIVNGASVFILTGRHDNAGEHETRNHGQSHQHDHSLRAAYLHVVADALTSLLAIFALLGAKYFGFVWMDPVMGIVGAVLVARWSWGLLRTTSTTLLDRRGPERIRRAIREGIESDRDARVADLHLWAIGSGIYAAEVSVVAHHAETVDYYKGLIPPGLGLVHVSVEVHRCEGDRSRGL